MKNIFLSFMLGSLMLISVFMISTPVAEAASRAYCNTESGNFLSFPTWYKYLNPTFSGGECNLNISFPQSIPAILFAVFEILLRIAGILAVVFIIFGGFQYLTTTGEPEKAKNARTTIINALVGLMIAMLATAVVNLIARNI